MKSSLRQWFQSPKRRRVLATSVAGLAVTLALSAVGVFAYPYYTNLRAGTVQRRLADTFATPQIKQAYSQRKLVDGSPLTRIEIPSIGTNTIVVEGTSIKALNTGAGHYPGTPLPGEAGNVAIAGHRTMYGQPFHRLEQIRSGDKVTLTTPFGKYVYEVIPTWESKAVPFVTAPDDWTMAAQSSQSMLTLTTCNPIGKSTNRLVAKAKLISSEKFESTKA
ncbi:MAG: class E sortase [Actinomycetota bacterium]